ncbi:MAG: hypothetical protein EKK41_27690 [Hyphomicrobiales bacterium]|nr:MAG: hypothetical protein EKK41_27690 [Hyphomicrobiales bacterium]
MTRRNARAQIVILDGLPHVEFSMRILFSYFVASIMVAAFGSGVHAQEKSEPTATRFTSVVPIFSQVLVYQYPTSFKAAFEAPSPQKYLLELVPKNESVDAWSEMITISGYKDLASKATPQDFAARIAGGFKNACPNSFAVQALGNLPVGGNAAFAAVVGCGTHTYKGSDVKEMMVMVVIRGAQDLYTVQWATRGSPEAGPPAIDRDAWMARIKDLSPLNLCTPAPGEKSPYPSCLNKPS